MSPTPMDEFREPIEPVEPAEPVMLGEPTGHAGPGMRPLVEPVETAVRPEERTAFASPGDVDDLRGPHTLIAGDIPVPPELPTPPVLAAARASRVRRPLPSWGWPARKRAAAPLLAILVLAAALRIYGYNWDEGTNLHPDENGISGHISGLDLPHSWAQFWSPSSPLNPHFAAYGHLPFYATALFGHVLGTLGRAIGGPFAGLAGADLPGTGIIESGRVLSGLADTGTLLFVYLIGRLVYDRRVGLLATLLGTFTVLDLEFSHFANVDTFLAFCTTGALYFYVRVARFGRPRDYAWAGAWIGFALACKVSAAPLIVPLVVAHIYRGSERGEAIGLDGMVHKVSSRRSLPANPLLLLLALAVTVVAVFATMPYAFIDFNNWWSDVWGQLQLAQGITEVPYTRKFSGLPAYWYPLQQLIGWTMGPPLGLAAVAGLVAAMWRQVRRRGGSELVLLAWAVVFFVATAGQYMKFLRYMLPLVPVLNLFAAALLVAMWRGARARAGSAGVSPAPTPSSARRGVARGVVIAAVALTVLYGLARENVYTGENTRVAATRWMAAHIPSGATVMNEGPWDEALPKAPAGLVVPSYRPLSVDILGPGDNTSTTVPQFVQALQTADYITISSARVLGSVAHQPERYPYSIRWYDLLFGDKLNFRLARSFTDPPHLGPFVINDAQAVPRADQYTGVHPWYEADQNESEYDHPPVYIFKRTGSIDPVRATALLTDNGRLHPAVVAYDPSHPMLLPPAVEQADQKAPAYNSVFSPSNPLARAPLLGWLLMVELLGLLALPLVMRACRGLLRDGGYALAKLCGILIVGYLTWLAASLRIATYSRGLILGACLLLLLLSLALGLRPRALWVELRARRRGIVWAELVFLGGFLAFAAVRAAYPDLWHATWGGERTQEVSFMNSILRSQYFPPADPWFAGGTLNYYYYGQYLMGMLMKLSGIAVPVGFNLALPTLYALMLSIAFSIGYNATGRLSIGAMALALEGVLGNLGMVIQFADPRFSPTRAGPSLIPGVEGLRDAFSGLVAVLTRQAQLPPDFFWGSSRILSTPKGDAINEFPIWSFTYGDMHAHVIDIPIVLGVILLALAVSGLGQPRRDEAAVVPTGSAGAYGDAPLHEPAPRATNASASDDTRAHDGVPAPRNHRLRVPQLLLLGALMAVVAGATGPTNLWDLPTAVLVLVAGFALRGFFALGRRGWPLVLRDIVAPGGALGLLCLALYRPFYASVLGISSGFTFLAPSTPTDQYLLHLGLPLFLLTSFALTFLWRQTRPLDRLERLGTVLQFTLYYRDQRHRLPRLYRLADALRRRRRSSDLPPARLSLHLLLFGALLALGLLLAGFTTLALIASLLTLVTIALVEACARARWLDPLRSQPFALVLAVMGLALTAIPDVVMQNEAGRMNTFFKLYNQAWPLLALSGALALAALLPPRRRAVPAASEERLPLSPRPAPLPALTLNPTPLTQGLSLATATAGTGSLPASRAYSSYIPRDVRDVEDIARGQTLHSGSAGVPPVPATPALGEWPEGTATLPPVVEAVGDGRDARASAQPEEWAAPAPADTGEAARHEGLPAAEAPAAVTKRLGPLHGEVKARSRLPALGGDLPGWGALWWAALALLTAGGALFPIFGIYIHLQLRNSWSQTASARIPTGLDGAAFVRALYPGDAAAIDWIDGHVTGMPVLLTSERGDYRDFAAKVTMLTGLPTITSWTWEDQQERYSGQGRPGRFYPTAWVNQLESGRVTWSGGRWVTHLAQPPGATAGARQDDVERIYNTLDPAEALGLLRQYHVSYIYVGTAERGDPERSDPNYYAEEVQTQGHARVGFDPAGLAKFDRMAATGQLRVVYRKLGVTIYKVLR